jgi:hypothetical protein
LHPISDVRSEGGDYEDAMDRLRVCLLVPSEHCLFCSGEGPRSGLHEDQDGIYVFAPDDWHDQNRLEVNIDVAYKLVKE